MQTTEALLRRSLGADGAGVRLTLDLAFQGLPGTAHGGSVLAALEAVAALGGIRSPSALPTTGAAVGGIGGTPLPISTHTLAYDATGRVVAAADVTFVAMGGAARKLCAWLTPLNAPGLMARIFPSYA